jgi:hypothetical protein
MVKKDKGSPRQTSFFDLFYLIELRSEQQTESLLNRETRGIPLLFLTQQ